MGSDATPVATDHDAFRFIKALFCPEDVICFRPIETWSEAGKKRSLVDYDGMRHEQFGSRCGDDWAWHESRLCYKLSEIIARSELLRTNVFFSCCPRVGPGGQYDQAWQIRTVRALWADIDDAKPSEAAARCKAAGVPLPSIVVASGRGTHLYWVLDQAALIDDADAPQPVLVNWIDQGEGKPKKRQLYIEDQKTKERLSLDARQNVPGLSAKAQHLQDIIAGIAAKIGGDHTIDLSRILRVPGTLNRKDQRNGRQPTPCVLDDLTDVRYPLEAFAQFAATSPARVRREKIAALPLPKKKKMNSKRQDIFDMKIAACAAADFGLRSEPDFSLCCFAIEMGMSAGDVWPSVESVGKFAGDQGYFELTWGNAQDHTREKLYNKAEKREKQKAEKRNAASEDGGSDSQQSAGADGNSESGDGCERFSNATFTTGDNDEEVATPLPVRDIIDDLRRRTDNWPRRVGGSLFVHDREFGVNWLDRPASLFGWIGSAVGAVDWRKGGQFVAKDEFFAELCRTATAYRSIETVPHCPQIPDYYYVCSQPEQSDGNHLQRLLDFFVPDDPLDRQLMQACFATGLWGGPGGSRPAFMVTSTTGRGRGKSSFCSMVGRLFGGVIDVRMGEDGSSIAKRLLSPGAVSLRVALLDNIKAARLSWPDLEAIITAPTVNGWRLYSGDASRPNTLLWLLTLNGPALAADMSQRVVPIRLGEPIYAGDWQEQVSSFIESNREKIFGDIAALLARPAKHIDRFSRWAAWDRDVLARCESPNELMALIESRRGEIDVDREEGHLFAHTVETRLAWLGFDLERDDVFIPSQFAVDLYNLATGEKSKIVGGSRQIRQLINERRLPTNIVEYRVPGEGSRGFRWIGKHCDSQDRIRFDFGERLKAKREDEARSSQSRHDESPLP